jgi:hypothetical protein
MFVMDVPMDCRGRPLVQLEDLAPESLGFWFAGHCIEPPLARLFSSPAILMASLQSSADLYPPSSDEEGVS